MKPRWSILLFLLPVLIASCTLEKRHYRNGFYLDWNSAQQLNLTRAVNPDTTSPAVVSSVPLNVDSALTDTMFSARDESADTFAAEKSKLIEAVKLQDLPVTGSYDDPKPDGKDRINPVISTLVGTAFALDLTFLTLYVIGIAPWVSGVITALVLFGLVLAVFAYFIRKKYAREIAAGNKDRQFRLSAHFYRFKVLLLCYFAAAAIGILGWILLNSAPGILAFIGVILASSGLVLIPGVGLVLLILFLLYLFRWRKDPSGYRPPRNPHPPKDH